MPSNLKRHVQPTYPTTVGATPPTTEALIAIGAVLSFLKETRGVLTWSINDLAHTLNVTVADAKRVTPFLEIQGYIKPVNHVWVTTIAGEVVSDSTLPRFTPDKVEKGLASLKKHIRDFNHSSKEEFTITDAVAFGDFLRKRSRAQAADVGIRIERRDSVRASVRHLADVKAIFTKLRAHSPVVHLRLFEDWMEARTHRRLILPGWGQEAFPWRKIN